MTRKSPRASSPGVAIEGDGDRLVVEGVLDIRTLGQARAALDPWSKKQSRSRVLDLKGLEGLDTAGALFLCELADRDIELAEASAEHQRLIDLIGALERKPLVQPRVLARWRQLVIQIGRGSANFRHDCVAIVAFVGQTLRAIARALVHPRELRPASISRQIADTGINALPIVGLLAVMISVVIGYQSVIQLRPYGSEDLAIDLIAVSILREMGVLITAILVAGRSGSAFTAEIGVMKARQEIDALEAMGLKPFELLVLPRLLALIVTLPLLTFFADLMGLLGGAAITQTLLHVSLPQYFDRVWAAVDMSDLFVGLIKAPVFAFFIATVGCMHGLRVSGSAESVGRETTRAVVKAIFLVIVFDALFSIVFERLDL